MNEMSSAKPKVTFSSYNHEWNNKNSQHLNVYHCLGGGRREINEVLSHTKREQKTRIFEADFILLFQG